MTILLCDPATGADGTTADDATVAVRTWLARELLFERLLGCWRAADDAARDGDGQQ